jgi:hypothetical protein
MENHREHGPSFPSPRTIEIRRHAALARALLDELDRVVPSQGAGARMDAVEQQLMEELWRLAHRILDCTATMIRAPGSITASDSDPHRNRLAKTRASAPPAAPSLSRALADAEGE